MTLRHFRIFIAVCEERNMTAAANRLYMTQPSVSQAIRELENYYEKKLFQRLSNRLFTTKEGEFLYEHASQIIQRSNQLDQSFRGHLFPSTLRIGSNYTVGSVLIHKYLDHYRAMSPSTKISVLVNKSSVLIEQLKSNRLDLILIEERPDNLDLIQTPFQQDRLALVVDTHHPLASRSSLSLLELSTEDFLLREKGAGVRDLFDQQMREKGYTVTPYWESTSTTSLVEAARHGYGIAVLPYELIKNNISNQTLVELHVPELDFQRNLVIATHKHQFLSSEIHTFLNAVLSCSTVS